MRSRVGERELIALMAALTVSTAMGVDMMLPALGDIRSSFGLPQDDTVVSWSVTGYILGMGFAQVIFGTLSDRFGRKTTLYAGLALYILGAIGSALSTSLTVLLINRLIWGIGAAAPRSLSVAIVRDTYSGDRMARVLTLIMAVFLIGPIVGPSVGELLLLSGTWRWVFGFGAMFACLLTLWTLRLGETLEPANRRSLSAKRIFEALRIIRRDRQAVFFGLAMTLEYGAFIAFLSSSELLFSDVYDRGGQFALLFGVGAALMAISAINSARAIRILGAKKVLGGTAVSYIVLAAALASTSAAGDGAPSFWLWFALLSLINALHVVITPICNSLAMLDMGELAGTASAIIGSVSMGVGSLLAAIPNSLSRGSVTPLSLSYLIYGALAVACIFWGLRGKRSALAAQD